MILARYRRLQGIIAGGMTLAAVINAGPLRADATMYRGNSGLTGAYTGKVTVPMALSWRYTANSASHNPSSAAVVGNTAFYADGNRVFAVDANTGALKWRYPEDEPLSTSIRSSLAIADGTVYFGAMDGKLYALNAETGKYDWAFDTKVGISSSPTVVDGVIYFGSDNGSVYAVDSKTKSVISAWGAGFKAGDEIVGAPAISNGLVFVLSVDQVLHAIGQSTGKERWFIRLPNNVSNMSPVAYGEYLYVTTGTQLICFLGRSGAKRWTQTLPADAVASPAVSDQGVFVLASDGHMYAFEPRTGKSKWKNTPKMPYDVVAPPSICGSSIFVGMTQGMLDAIDADTGAIKWTYTVQPSSNDPDAIDQYANIAAAPTVSDNTLYVVSDDGTLSAFRPDAIDTTAPSVSALVPDMGIVINGNPPIRFEAMITDEGSGINIDSIRLLLDGEGIAKRPEGKSSDESDGFKFDIHTSTLEYDTPEPKGASVLKPLAEGRHTVSVIATDWKGNTVNKTWTFTVDNTITRSGKKVTPVYNPNTPGGSGTSGAPGAPGTSGRGGYNPNGPGSGGYGPGSGGGRRGGGRRGGGGGGMP